MSLDFTKVDCTLYRVPPIDASRVEQAINEALIQAWQNQANPNQAIESILNNSSVTEVLSSQIENNLSFQREQFTQQVQQEADAVKYQAEAEAQDKLGTIESTLGKEAELKKQEYAQTEQYSQARIEEYSAASQRLAEMKQRIEQKLEQMGGYDRLNKVLEVHKVLTVSAGSVIENYASGSNTSGNTPGSTSVENKSYAAKTEAGKAEAGSTGRSSSKESPSKEGSSKDDSLEDKIEASGKKVKQKEGKLRKVGKAIWKVLNYKIW